MLTKTLIVCLLAFLCLNLATANRLETRIAGPTIAKQGQFPYIAFVSYNFVNADGQSTSQQFTGIIYSSTGIITAASNFVNFVAGSTLTVQVGSWDVNQPLASYTLTPTITIYNSGDAVPTTGDLVYIPSEYTAGESANNVAIIRINPAGNVIDFTNAEVSIANFPTSQPLRGEQFVAVAYGNQAPSSAVYPFLKYVDINLSFDTRCNNFLAANGLSAIDRATQFCVRSQKLAATNNLYEGVCGYDVGGVIVRTKNPETTSYYEVVGLITSAGDTTTCDSTARVPVVVNYLTTFQDTFFTPILGSLTDAGNGQDADQNDNSDRGLDICGDGNVAADGAEQCDIGSAARSTSPCCSRNTCNWKKIAKKCGAKGTSTCKPERCQLSDAADPTSDRVCVSKPRNNSPDASC